MGHYDCKSCHAAAYEDHAPGCERFGNIEAPDPVIDRHMAGEGEATDTLERDYTKRRIKELIDEGDGFWVSCSGCQESNEGCVSTDDYPYSDTFRCQPGSGCGECGGIGVVWDDTDYSEYAAFDAHPAPAPASVAMVEAVERALSQPGVLEEPRVRQRINVIALAAALSVSDTRADRMREAARSLLPYLRFTIGPESPGHHPTMPSAVKAFEEAYRALTGDEA